MTSIAASLPSYTPPVSVPTPPPVTVTPPTAVQATVDQVDKSTSNPAPDTPPVANSTPPPTYTALASASESNIRGTSVNTTA